MRVVLRSATLFLALICGVHIPFVAVNKLGASIVGLLSIVFVLGLPYWLLRRGHVKASAVTLLSASGLAATSLVIFGRNMTTPGITLQLVVGVIAAVVLGRTAAILTAISCLSADLAVVVLESHGVQVPVYFPGNPLVSWSLAALSFLLAAPPLYTATRTMRAALDQVQRQLSRRREAEEEILYQAQLIAQTADPIIAADNRRTVTYWNEAATRLLGWTEEEALGKPLDEVVPMPAGDVTRKKVFEALHQSGSFSGELQRLTRSGSLVTVDAAIRVLRNAAGERIGSVAGFRDITERRRTEQALRQSDEWLLSITETAPVGIAVISPDARMVFANSFVTSLIGLSKQDVIGRRIDDLAWNFTDFAGNPISWDRRPYSQVMATGQPVFDARMLLHSAGRRVATSLSVAPIIGADGKIEAVVSVMEDITARRELEERYLHAQKMESLGRLAGGIAHDFNNLLTVINGYSQLMLRNRALDPQLKAPLEQVHSAGEGAAGLCQQLLAFSRKQIVSPRPLPLNDAVLEAEKILRRVLGEDVKLVTRLDAGAGLVMADGGQMQQVLMNLVLNARDAMPHGGRVSISTGRIESPPDDPARDSDAAAGPYVSLVVEDTGVGMDEQTQQRIFEPFFTTKEPGKGTGLGLSTVYGIVKQNGGWMRVDSERWKGARFSVFLPRIENLVAVEAVPEKPVAGGSETVLVVEDQAEVRRFLIDCLRHYGYRVFGVGSGEAALELARRENGSIDALVSDMIMPGISGREVAGTLRAANPDLRVLLVTGYSEETVEPLGAGPDPRMAILPKPVLPETLASTLRRLLDAAPAVAYNDRTATRTG
jgi:two-component system, cell cycle sensor histidine kinase and response regulator CckA